MKDAMGHGSNSKGTHSSGISRLPRLRVEKQIAAFGRTAAGQRNTSVGAVWQKVAGGKRRAVAERIAQYARIDNPDARVRIR